MKYALTPSVAVNQVVPSDGEEDVLDAFKEFADYIKGETLATVYEQKKNDNLVDINGNDVYITIEKN